MACGKWTESSTKYGNLLKRTACLIDESLEYQIKTNFTWHSILPMRIVGICATWIKWQPNKWTHSDEEYRETKNKSELGNSAACYARVGHFCKLHCCCFFFSSSRCASYSTSLSFYGISHDSFPFGLLFTVPGSGFLFWHSLKNGNICPAARDRWSLWFHLVQLNNCTTDSLQWLICLWEVCFLENETHQWIQLICEYEMKSFSSK